MEACEPGLPEFKTQYFGLVTHQLEEVRFAAQAVGDDLHPENVVVGRVYKKLLARALNAATR